MKSYTLKPMELKLNDDFDVIIAGGGPAGCAAAIAAAHPPTPPPTTSTSAERFRSMILVKVSIFAHPLYKTPFTYSVNFGPHQSS